MGRELFGLFYGIVQKGDDPEHLDRLAVKLERDGTVTTWASLVHPTNWYVLPDADDTVVVAFIDGDERLPVILGGVWSDPKPAPEVNKDGKNNFRGYRSRTGHRLILDDSEKTKAVLVDMKGKNVVGIGDHAAAGAGPNSCEVFMPAMASGSGVSISAMEGSLEIACTGSLSIKAENIKINAKQSFEGSVKATMTLQGASKVKATSAALNIDLQLLL